MGVRDRAEWLSESRYVKVSEMIHSPILRQDVRTAEADLLVEALRCWQQSREDRQEAQPSLYRLLHPKGLAMLAPAFDSLLSMYESALGRPVSVGKPGRPSTDESMLIALIEGQETGSACIDCADSAALSLDCALCSVRILLTLDASDRVSVDSGRSLSGVRCAS